jgi:hypothetical protein
LNFAVWWDCPVPDLHGSGAHGFHDGFLQLAIGYLSAVFGLRRVCV